MALTRCRECGKEVSTDARSCPHCGAKDPAMAPTADDVAAGRANATNTPVERTIITERPVAQPRRSGGGAILFLILLLIAAAAAWYFGWLRF